MNKSAISPSLKRTSESVKFSHIIDALTDSISHFGIIRDETNFEAELDFIISKMDNVEIKSSDTWNILQENYSKLKYIYELVNFYNMPADGKFIENMKKFMELVDKQNQIYLCEIDWNDKYDNHKVLVIKRHLHTSLQRYNVFEKLSDVLCAYEILITVVEQIRGEKHKYFVDPTFTEQFEQPIKRQKI